MFSLSLENTQKDRKTHSRQSSLTSVSSIASNPIGNSREEGMFYKEACII
jgi:hypothetical protein